MDAPPQLLNSQLGITVFLLVLALIGGVGVFILFFGLFVPTGARQRRAAAAAAGAKPAARRTRLTDIQAAIDKKELDISAAAYIKRSLKLGIPLAIALYVLVGSISLVIVGVIAGFMMTWTKLEEERDKKQIVYSKQLTSACDTIRASYGVTPSLKRALEAVAEYSRPPVRDDFQEILLATSQERMVEGLQAVADRRRSIVFDNVATSIIRASEASGEVSDMLVRLAESTRQNVAAFEDAIASQLNARSSIQWGTFGPWLIFCVFRVMTVAMSFSSGANLLGPMATFFSTPAGNVLALVAALISIAVYRSANQIAQRGLVIRRVTNETSDPSKMAGVRRNHPLSAQTRPVSLQ